MPCFAVRVVLPRYFVIVMLFALLPSLYWIDALSLLDFFDAVTVFRKWLVLTLPLIFLVHRGHLVRRQRRHRMNCSRIQYSQPLYLWTCPPH
jgi:hypothetical protein